MKPEIKVGQTWKSRDGGSLLKVSLVDATHAHGASPDGSKPRKVALARLTAKGRNGYELWEDTKDAPPEAKADPHAGHCTMDACKYGDPKCSMAPRALPIHPLDSLAQRLGVTPEVKADESCGYLNCPAGCDTHRATPPAAPSPLEVVRRFIRNDGGMKAPTWKEAESALATLEESIRADERERCAKVADARSAHHAQMQRRMGSDVGRAQQRAASEACGDTAEFIRARCK